MSSRVLPLVWQLLVVLLASVPTGWAATAKCSPGWEWSRNSKNQSSCEVAGYLQGACLGSGVNEPESLAPKSSYAGPKKGDTKGLKCGCNTVIYSLYSACAACQNASTQTWSQWSKNCNNVSVAQYPFNISSGTAIPQWAFINVTKTDKFNATAAEKVGRDPEALEQVSITLSVSSTSSRRVHTSHSSLSTLLTSGLSSSPTVSLSTSSAFGPLSTNGESNSNGSTSDQKTDLPAIIGGVVGGVFGFIILSLLIWFFLRRRSREALPRAAPHPLSHHTLSVRGSYYPPSVSVYSSEPEMAESGNKAMGVYNPLDTTLHESVNSHRGPLSAIGSAESDAYTTRFSTLHGTGKGRDGRTEV